MLRAVDSPPGAKNLQIKQGDAEPKYFLWLTIYPGLHGKLLTELQIKVPISKVFSVNDLKRHSFN